MSGCFAEDDLERVLLLLLVLLPVSFRYGPRVLFLCVCVFYVRKFIRGGVGLEMCGQTCGRCLQGGGMDVFSVLFISSTALSIVFQRSSLFSFLSLSILNSRSIFCCRFLCLLPLATH